jgi:hypothetical protein
LIGKYVIKSIVDELVTLRVRHGIIPREPDASIVLIVRVSNLLERELV